MRRFVPKQLAEKLTEGGSIAQETRLVTALFADVSGFTALSTRVDAETLASIIDPVIARMSSVVGKYEGYINSFAGDAILALFGAPIGHEDDADRALMAALEMHQAIDVATAQLHEEGADLKLHIGINTGHVVARLFGDELRTDYSVLGESVNMAQRLESQAPTGETFIGEMTYELTKDRFELEHAGEFQLKGKSEPVPAWRLIARKATGESTGRRAHALVGRDVELSAITTAIDDLAHGRGSVIELTGEPGVGKTRLTQEGSDHARGLGLRRLGARCISYGASVAYFPYAELLRAELGITFEQHPAESTSLVTQGLEATGNRDAAPFLARMLGLPPPDDGVAVDELEPEAFRRGLHDAVASWLVSLAEDAPLLLTVEDLHWADEASADLTRHLAARTLDSAVTLFLTGRPEGRATLAKVAREIPDDRRVAVALEPLDEAHTDDLVAACLGGPPPEELLALAADRAAGNPFFVEELVRSLTERGDVVLSRHGWRMRDGFDATSIPPTVEEVLSGRMDRLGSVAAQVLQMAAVIGRRVNVALLEGMAEDITDLHGALGQLIDAEFLDTMVFDGEEQLAFRHALVVDVAYGRMSRRQRRELHRRLAETGEALYGAADDTIDLLARHFYLAEAGAKAVDHLGRAADRARRLFANDEAIMHLERAVELARQSSRQRDALVARLLDLAEVYDVTGGYDVARELYEEVRATTNDVRAWRGLASVARRRGDVGSALQLVDEALACEALDGVDVSSLWLERAWTLVSEGRFGEAIQATEAALDAAPDPLDPVVGHLLLQQAQAETWTGRLEDALEHAARAEDIFQGSQDLRGLTVALRVLGNVQVEAGLSDDAVRTLLRGLELAERTGSVDEVIGCLVNLGLLELRRGNLEDAIGYDVRALKEAERVGHAVGAMIAQVNLAEMLLASEDLDWALAACEQALDKATAIDDTQCIADVHRIAAVIHLREGRYGQALQEGDEAAALFLEIGNLGPAAQALEVASHAAEGLGDTERARRLMDRARSVVEQEHAGSG